MFRARIERPAGSRALGFLLALVIAGFLLTTKPAHASTTFTVNSTGDAGDFIAGGACDADPFTSGNQCTLRAAIELANATPGADTVNFNIGGGSGVKTISPGSDLPEITDPVVIDGYTQPGTSPNTQAQGTNAVLMIELNGASAGVQARGLKIKTSNSVVRGLVINNFGVANVGGVGVVIDGGTGNRIEGNFIGTDPTGTLDLGNGGNGVSLSSSANKTTVGGTDAGDGKIDGVVEARNLISGNGGEAGVGFSDSQPSGVKIQGNLIGTKKDGTSPLGNDGRGVNIRGNDTAIGGDEAGAANVIAFNGLSGVAFSFFAGTGNRILSNSIFSNGELGIDLVDNGRTANDPKDPDTGPNNLQNFPVLASAKTSSGTTTITGTLNSTPSTKKKKRSFTIQFFSNPSGTDIEGKKFIGQTTVKTDRQGDASFSFVPAEEVPVGEAITATATRNSTGDTSEFSDPVTVS